MITEQILEWRCNYEKRRWEAYIQKVTRIFISVTHRRERIAKHWNAVLIINFLHISDSSLYGSMKNMLAYYI